MSKIVWVSLLNYFKYGTILIILAGVVLLSCSDEESPTCPQPDTIETFNYADYVFMQPNSYALLAFPGSDYPYYIDGDYSLGEPFTDLNGNGVYDFGFDIFVRSIGEDNMDINHNGKYDGPNDRWSEGIPYDDVNRNGVYDLPNNHYDVGEPFCDADGDSVYQSHDGFRFEIALCRENDSVAGASIFEFYKTDSVFEFTADSGEYVCYPEREWYVTQYGPRKYDDFDFMFTDSGMFYHCPDVLHRWPPDLTLPVLLKTDSVLGIDSFVVALNDHFNQDMKYRREIKENAKYIYRDSLLTDLLLVRFSHLSSTEDTTVWEYLEAGELEFYFDKERGLVAFESNYVISWGRLSMFLAAYLPTPRYQMTRGIPLADGDSRVRQSSVEMNNE